MGRFLTQPRSGTMVFSFLKDSFNKILSINIPIFQYKTVGNLVMLGILVVDEDG